MIKVQDIYTYLDAIAPFQTQMDFDNSGLLVGSPEAPVRRVMVALDVTLPVVKEAARNKCQLIVSHHPVIFHPLKSVCPEDPGQNTVIELIRQNIAVISAHTNLDVAPDGLNDALIDTLGIPVKDVLEPLGNLNGTPYGLGRWGELPQPMSAKDFAKAVKKSLNAKGLRAHLAKRPVQKVAVAGGACGDLVGLAATMGMDALVTADVKYNYFLDAAAYGITLIDAGHFATENVVVPVLKEKLVEQFSSEIDVMVSSRHREVYTSV